MSDYTLILLDMDGVLIDSRGYREALRDTVDHFALQMGVIPPHLTEDEITHFEACGMTNEWLSGAFCLAALLMAVADEDLAVIRLTLEETIVAVREVEPAIDRPDFSGLAAQLLDQHPEGLHHSASIAQALEGMTPPALHRLLNEILLDVHPPNAPVACIFQNLVLGQQMFQETYGYRPMLDVKSYLQSKDQPLLNRAVRMVLKQFITHEGHGAAIYTARPSLPPTLNGLSPNSYAPEAEMGSTLVGLEDFPLVGGGHMRWLSEQKGLPSDAYCKPSPVHTLAALGAAIAGDAQPAMEASIRVFEEGLLENPFEKLRSHHTEIVIYEDGLAGIKAAREAIRLLHAAGLDATLTCIGISGKRSKRDSLARVADQVLPNINAAVRDLIERR